MIKTAAAQCFLPSSQRDLRWELGRFFFVEKPAEFGDPGNPKVSYPIV
jgi:hypothetical protein